MSPLAKRKISNSAEPRNGCGRAVCCTEAIRANHAQLVKRNAYHRRFGYDPEASVAFVLEKALPLRGRVLDVGTGKGRFVIALARHVAHITTVDNDIHQSKGERHPHPPNRFAHWGARLQSCGFAVRSYTGCNQQVLVAGPASRTRPAPTWFPRANGRES